MLIRSNSGFVTKAYQKYAPYPKAFSLTEWIYKTIAIGRTDSDIYWTQGIHLMDLVWVENRWAYHSQDDSVENVKTASLQSGGDNIISIVVGTSKSADFPKRISNEYLIEVRENGGMIGMESGSVYFSLLGGAMIWMPLEFARIMYMILSVFLGLTLPLIVGNEFQENPITRKVTCCSIRLAKVSIQHSLRVLVNLLLGLVTSVVAFAAFGMWKSPSQEEIERRDIYVGFLLWPGVELEL